MSDISLNAGIRSNLLSLQQSTELFNRTTERLASGKKVNSAIDNPTNFFASVNLTDRSQGLSARLDGMGQAIQQIKAADTGITTIRSFIGAMKGVLNNALGNSDGDARVALGKQFNELIVQISTVAKDSGYQGVNLLERNETTTVQFNESFDDSVLDVKGFDIQGPGGDNRDVVDSNGEIPIAGIPAYAFDTNGNAVNGNVALAVDTQDGDAVGIQGAQSGATAGSGMIDWGNDDTYKAELSTVVRQIETFDEVIKTQASNLAQNLATITIREEFSNELINTLNEGSDKLVLADLNEEGANLLALQTSNALATQSLSLASQQSQQVLQLLG